MRDEPIFWADQIAKRGIDNVGVLVEQSLIGESYIRQFRRACATKGIRIVAEEQIPQTAQDVTAQVTRLHDAGVDSVVHCGFGFGVVLVGFAMQALDWDPPRFMGTAFQNAWINEIVWDAVLGWTGLDQYDEANELGQEFLDQFEKRTGRRPQYCVPVVNRDLATILLTAFADAHPLSPRGVKDALERVHLLPAASGVARHPALVREVDPAGLGRYDLPRRPPPRPRRHDVAPGRPVHLMVHGDHLRRRPTWPH
jgi:ABC-type branched-subunit amino acid transport system substrate-binding protein